METAVCKKNERNLRNTAIPIVFLLFLLITPLSAFSQDTNSINTLREMGKAFAQIAGKASPAVVGIKVESKARRQDYPTMQSPFDSPGDPFGNDEFFERFFRRQMPRSRSPQQRPQPRSTAQGSGFIISADGYILTNNHLVGEAEKVLVKVRDEAEVEAKIIGTDPDSDVAVIKIDKKNLSFVEFADSDKLEVGEWVLAIGNPFGLSHTVTAGIVSAKGRSGVGLATYEDFIQTDAAINPGNSGGPLLNLDGKVVGINAAIMSPNAGFLGGAAGNVGIGLAIPINMAKSVYEQLAAGGPVTRGFLGVNIQDLTAETAASLGIDKDTKGVVIPDVTADSAADKAGMKPYDVVVEFNGQAVEKARVLQNKVAMLKPGTKVEVVVLRDDKRKTLTVELGERPKQETASAGKSNTLEQMGITVQDLNGELSERFGYKGLSGVVVTDVDSGSPAALVGIEPGALIMEINRTAVTNVKEFNEAVSKATEEGSIMLLIKQQGFKQLITMVLPKKEKEK
jgi:serine protease Do